MNIMRKAAAIIAAVVSAVSLAQPIYAAGSSDTRNAEIRKARQCFSKKKKYKKSFENILDTAETDFVIKYKKVGTKKWKIYTGVDSLSKGKYTFRLYGRASGTLCGSASARLDDGSGTKTVAPGMHFETGTNSFLGSFISKVKKTVKKVKKKVSKIVKKVKKNVKKVISKTVKTVKKAASSVHKSVKKVTHSIKKSVRHFARKVLKRTPKPIRSTVSKAYHSLKSIRKTVKTAKRNIIHSAKKKAQAKHDASALTTVLTSRDKNLYYISKTKIKLPKAYNNSGTRTRRTVVIHATDLNKAKKMIVEAHKKYGGYCNYVVSIGNRKIKYNDLWNLTGQMDAIPGACENSSYFVNKDSTAIVLFPRYEAYTKKKKEYVKKEAKNAAKKIKKDYHTTDAFSKMNAINDYVCKNTSYDYDAVKKEEKGSRKGIKTANERRTAYDFFKNKKSICVGYAQAYYEIAKASGLKCRIVIGKNKDPKKSGHAWNQVYAHGTWYNVDSTWNDTITEKSGSKFVATKYITVAGKKTVFDEAHKDFAYRSSYGD